MLPSISSFLLFQSSDFGAGGVQNVWPPRREEDPAAATEGSGAGSSEVPTQGADNILSQHPADSNTNLKNSKQQQAAFVRPVNFPIGSLFLFRRSATVSRIGLMEHVCIVVVIVIVVGVEDPPGWLPPPKVAGSLMKSCLCCYHGGPPPGWLTPPLAG